MSSWQTTRWRAVEQALQQHVDRGYVAGVSAVIAHTGRVDVITLGAMAFGGEPLRPDAVFRIASLTKPIAGAATLALIEDGLLRLDDPVARWLPELAAPRVLPSLDAPLDMAVPAREPIRVRHLLTMTMGLGSVLAAPGTYPIQRAMQEAGLAPGPDPSPLEPSEWMRRLAALPLVHEPGEGFMYHTSFDVLGVLLARACGTSLEHVLNERIFAPLGMADTHFALPADQVHRLPTAYRTGTDGWGLEVYDEAASTRWSPSVAFESAGGGLVSTARDYLAFARMLHREGEGVLSSESMSLMTTDALTPAQRQAARAFLGLSSTWGLGLEINQRRAYPWMTPGRFGWSGGLGTTAYVDPAWDVIGILMTQRLMDNPEPPQIASDFWRTLYASL